MIEPEERALTTLYNLDSYVLPHVTNVPCPDIAMRHCWEQVNFHLSRAREYLEGVVVNPQSPFDDDREFYRMLARALPFLILSQSLSPQASDQTQEESSPASPASDQSDSDNYVPATPP